MLWPDGSDQVTWRTRLRCGSAVGGSPEAIVASGRLKSGVEILRVDELVRPHVLAERASDSTRARLVAEIEERLPADEAPAGSGAATQVDRVGLTLSDRIEDHAEEGRRLPRGVDVATQVRPIRWTHHAVTEAVCGS